MKQNRLAAFFAVTILLWLAFIFGCSAKTAPESSAQSKSVTRTFLEIVDKSFNTLTEEQQQNRISNTENFVRKCAHMFLYAVLGILSMCFFTVIAKYKPPYNALYTVIFCMLYAATDEFHQLFVPGRGAQVRDVVIDTCGSLIGTAVFLLAMYAVNRIRAKRKSS